MHILTAISGLSREKKYMEFGGDSGEGPENVRKTTLEHIIHMYEILK